MIDEDSEIAEEIPETGHPRYVGILLVNRKPGLQYVASAPGLEIRAERHTKSDEYRVHFFKRSRSGVRMRAVLIGGHDRDSIERCIMEAVNHPSLLRFKPVRSPQAAPAIEKPHMDVAPKGMEFKSWWPDIPGVHDPADTINVRVVSEDKIYLAVTKNFRVGVWRKNDASNFHLQFTQHGTQRVHKCVVGPSVGIVREFIRHVNSKPHVIGWKRVTASSMDNPAAQSKRSAVPKVAGSLRARTKNKPRMLHPRKKGGIK